MLEIHKAGLIPLHSYFNSDSVLERTIDGENQYTLVGFSNAIPSGDEDDPDKPCECVNTWTVDDIGIGDWKRDQALCYMFL
ncbi:hypothetical protein QCA50_009103 [Cerrena zonata]|uniref:Uncharacterized protein n=1 Tax=Cerrena zonata TaxID=2478898 RepID=A0AAW0G8G2_9APHY